MSIVYTAQERDRIRSMLAAELIRGYSIRVACEIAGISTSTYARWVKEEARIRRKPSRRRKDRARRAATPRR
jgi:transposase